MVIFSEITEKECIKRGTHTGKWKFNLCNILWPAISARAELCFICHWFIQHYLFSLSSL